MKRMSVLLVTAFAMSGVVRAQDDVYFIPSKEVRVVRSVDGTVVDNVAAVSSDASGYQEVRDVDEYNRRRTPADTSVSGAVRDVDASVGDYNDEVDYPCTKMVMRFYGPRPGIVVSSPYYWDICYGDVWGVYYDNWAWSTPSYAWWTYTYDPWYYSRWHYRTCWDYTWGWYDPWWSRSYWGWNRPVCWGRPRPAFNPHHLGRPMWAHRTYGHGGYSFGYNGGRRGFVSRDFGHGGSGYRRDIGGGRRPAGGFSGRGDGPRIVRAPGRGDNTRTDYRRSYQSDNNRAYGRGENTAPRRESYGQPQRTEPSSRRGYSPSFGQGSRPSSGGGAGRVGGGGGVSRGGGRR